jgi:signal transduction histidine kinase
MEHVRDVMAELRPPALVDYGLAAALRLLGKQFARRAGLSVHVSAAETFPRLSTAAEMALFRVAQEAMTNIVKHARAGEVRITMEGGEDGLRLAISDDGVGFDPLSPKLGGGTAALGLALMRERARAIGWEFLVESAPGKGAKVVVELARRE